MQIVICNKYVKLGYCYQSKAKLWGNLFHAVRNLKDSQTSIIARSSHCFRGGGGGGSTGLTDHGTAIYKHNIILQICVTIE